jgi:hypothetical protein
LNVTNSNELPNNSPDLKTQIYLEEKERQRLEEEKKKKEEEALLANITDLNNPNKTNTKDKFQASYPTLLTNEQIQYGGFLIYLAGKYFQKD